MEDWKRKQKRDAKDFQGYEPSGSGNRWYRPGDVKTEFFLIESKYTSKKSYSVSLKTLHKLRKQADFSYKVPILSMQIQDDEWVVLDKEDFLKMLELLKKKGV